MTRFSEIMTTLSAPTEFYFVRHGESEGNIEGRMQGHLDRPLTTLGRSQARSTGEWFAQHAIEFSVVFSSPLQRALETARIIARSGGYPDPRTLDSAKELNTGRFTDLSIPEIRERYPVEYAEFIVGSWESVPEAERAGSLTTRALETWKTVADTANEHGGGTFLTVTHGGMMQWIVKASFGASPDEPPPWMPLVLASNCAVFHFIARPVKSVDRNGNDLRWYYGQWSMLNFTPAEESSAPARAREQFHTHDRQETNPVR